MTRRKKKDEDFMANLDNKKKKEQNLEVNIIGEPLTKKEIKMQKDFLKKRLKMNYEKEINEVYYLINLLQDNMEAINKNRAYTEKEKDSKISYDRELINKLKLIVEQMQKDKDK